jgi:hypothetical protein
MELDHLLTRVRCIWSSDTYVTLEPQPKSHPQLLVVHTVPTDEVMTTESERYNCFSRNGGNPIP